MSIRKGNEILAITPDKIEKVNNKNDNTSLTFWTGTLQEYNAITVKDSNTLYNITDDNNISTTLLELLFPVGAIYQGTMGVCPLQVLMPNTQWELTAQGRVLQGADENHIVGQEVDSKLPNIVGYLGGHQGDSATGMAIFRDASGAFTLDMSIEYAKAPASASTGWAGNNNYKSYNALLDASKSNDIYSNDCNTVQPPAKVVNIWERIL